MQTFLKSIQIEGFKSIRSSTLELQSLNVLIGANGAGKSNFISFFKMLNHMMTDSFSLWVEQYAGGASSVLHLGVKKTNSILGKLEYQTEQGVNTYQFVLAYAPAGDTLIFTDESVGFQRLKKLPALRSLGAGHKETLLISSVSEVDPTKKTARFVSNLLKRTRVYQFHDTSDSARIKQNADVSDDFFLKSDAGNLAAVLLNLRQNFPRHYERIVQTIRLSAPFFNDFVLEPNGQKIRLRYSEFGSDTVFGVHQISDGTLRFMALMTLLLQPIERMPSVIIVDEPELGLHPHALETLLSVMRSVSTNRQIIVSTQSIALVDHLEPEEIIIAERHGFETQFKRLDSQKLKTWLEEYSLGELWEMNVLGGRPSR